jgi:hypothetical protein
MSVTKERGAVMLAFILGLIYQHSCKKYLAAVRTVPTVDLSALLFSKWHSWRNLVRFRYQVAAPALCEACERAARRWPVSTPSGLL